MDSNTLPDFTDKIVCAQLVANGGRWDLYAPGFERQGEKLCLVGKPIAENRPWGRECMVAVSWDQVSWYTVFDSHEAYMSWFNPETPPVRRKWFR